jgi:mono/diheme cytochrome c family protein
MTMIQLKRAARVIATLGVLFGGAWTWTALSTRAEESSRALDRAAEQAFEPIAVQNQPAAKGDAAQVKRGEYLVNEVARCGDCHTPRNAKGALDLTRHLQGATMWFTPKRKGEFEDHAPDITFSGRAGKWTEAKMARFLSTGEKSDPPMPAYKLTVEDAQAVTAYLRSLPGRGKDAGKNRDD